MNVLLIEDNQKDIEALERALKSIDGVKVTVESSYDAALGGLRGAAPDVILLDLTLSDGRGMQGLSQLCERLPEVPLVALCDIESESFAFHAVREGAQDFIVKSAAGGKELKLKILMACERHKFQRSLVRLASFAWQNPNAIIETDRHGKLIYLNPAGKKQFPGLTENSSHPFIMDLPRIIDQLQREKRDLATREIRIGEYWYEQHIFFVPETGILRSYITDVTEKKRAEEKLKSRTREVERMNRLMVGRELKMKELKLKIALLTSQLKNSNEKAAA